MSLKAALIKYLPRSLGGIFFDCSYSRNVSLGLTLLHLTLICFCIDKFGFSFELVSVAFATMPICLLLGKKGIALNLIALLLLLFIIFPSTNGQSRFWYIGLGSAFLLDYVIIALAMQEMQKEEGTQKKIIEMQQAQLLQLQAAEIELLKQIDHYVIKEETSQKKHSEVSCDLQAREKLISSMQHEIELLQHEGDSLRQHIVDCHKSLAILQWEQQQTTAQHPLVDIICKKELEQSYEKVILEVEQQAKRLEKDHTALKMQLHDLQSYGIEWKTMYVALQQEALVSTLNCERLQAAHTKNQQRISLMQQQMQQMQKELLQHEDTQSNGVQRQRKATLYEQQTQEFVQQIKQTAVHCLRGFDHFKQMHSDLLSHISLLPQQQLLQAEDIFPIKLELEEEIALEQKFIVQQQELHHVQNLYKQLRVQFEEKQQVLAQTRAELFDSETAFLSLKNDITLSDMELDCEWRYFEKDLQQQQQDLKMAQHEVQILHDIIDVLVK